MAKRGVPARKFDPGVPSEGLSEGQIKKKLKEGSFITPSERKAGVSHKTKAGDELSRGRARGARSNRQSRLRRKAISTKFKAKALRKRVEGRKR